MLHHLSLGVSSLERAAGFYDATLSALGYVRVLTQLRPWVVCHGPAGGGDNLAIKLVGAAQAVAPEPRFYVAFAAPFRDAFGGRDNGAPGLRPGYGEKLLPRICHRSSQIPR